jgi:hypothetical protein
MRGRITNLLEWFKDLWSWAGIVWALLGLFGLAAGIAGLATSIGGTVWAIAVGIPIPIAIMVGFCVFGIGVYLAMAPLMYRVLMRAAVPIIAEMNAADAEKPRREPAYVAWRLLDCYELNDAAKLWCDLDPGSPSTRDTVAWAEAFKSAIKQKEIVIETRFPNDFRMTQYENEHPAADTRITRESLKGFAKKTGTDPVFLRD